MGEGILEVETVEDATSAPGEDISFTFTDVKIDVDPVFRVVVGCVVRVVKS